MLRINKLEALYCNFLSLIDEFKNIDHAINKWLKK